MTCDLWSTMQAPELFNDGAVGERCDVFSFAIMLWEAISRSKPYDGLEPVQVLLKMSTQARSQTHPPCRPTWCSKTLSLLAIVVRCREEEDHSFSARAGFCHLTL